MQSAFRNLLRGTSQVSPAVNAEAVNGKVSCSLAHDLRDMPFFVWYDYFCCPQAEVNSVERQRAIDSIHHYVAMCEHFIVLCPALRHESGDMLNQRTWSLRGWCRAERVARELATVCGPIIAVESETSLVLLTELESWKQAVGDGHFTVDEDRKKMAGIVLHLIYSKLLFYLQRQDLPNYRFMLNQQQLLLKNLEIHSLDLSIPGFSPGIDPFLEPQAFLLARFMHETLWYFTVTLDPYLFWVYWVS